MKGLLFMCVANSARSQLAEGLARTLLPSEVKIWSAGSRPTHVRPEAIAVLKEVGIDISHHHSKAVSDIPADQVDTVVTLCAEEVCPVFLGKVRRLHWPIPDPATDDPSLSHDQRLARFRAARDTIRTMIKKLADEKGTP
jgi:arsenate reductase (thioredoxin)